MQVHGLFPTLVLQEDDADHSFIKSSYMRTLMKHLTPDGYSRERTGHVTLHHDPVFEPIFITATKVARQYCEVMQINPALFDFNVVKSWFNIVRDDVTPFHNHGDAHLSFVYYINVPADVDQKIRFFRNEMFCNDPFPGFTKFNEPQEWNPFNSLAWSFDAVEGRMYLFNADLAHDTTGQPIGPEPGVTSIEDAATRRISIAGDILLTYKEKEAKPLGLQPKRNWRMFDGGTRD